MLYSPSTLGLALGVKDVKTKEKPSLTPRVPRPVGGQRDEKTITIQQRFSLRSTRRALNAHGLAACHQPRVHTAPAPGFLAAPSAGRARPPWVLYSPCRLCRKLTRPVSWFVLTSCRSALFLTFSGGLP